MIELDTANNSTPGQVLVEEKSEHGDRRLPTGRRLMLRLTRYTPPDDDSGQFWRTELIYLRDGGDNETLFTRSEAPLNRAKHVLKGLLQNSVQPPLDVPQSRLADFDEIVRELIEYAISDCPVLAKMY